MYLFMKLSYKLVIKLKQYSCVKLNNIRVKLNNIGSGYIYGPVTKDFFAIFTAFLSAHVQASHDLVCYYFLKKLR